MTQPDAAYFRQRYHKIKKRIHDLLGNQCGADDCSCSEDLHIVDVSEDGPRFSLADWFCYSDEVLVERLKTCKLLCKPHRLERRRLHRPWRHGTWWSYFKKKCKYDECEEYHLDYVLRRREDRRAAGSQIRAQPTQGIVKERSARPTRPRKPKLSKDDQERLRWQASLNSGGLREKEGVCSVAGECLETPQYFGPPRGASTDEDALMLVNDRRLR